MGFKHQVRVMKLHLLVYYKNKAISFYTGGFFNKKSLDTNDQDIYLFLGNKWK